MLIAGPIGSRLTVKIAICRFGDFSDTFTFIFWSTVFSPPLLQPHPHYVIYLCVIAFHLSSFLLSLEYVVVFLIDCCLFQCLLLHKTSKPDRTVCPPPGLLKKNLSPVSARSYQSCWPRAVATLITLASGPERFREKSPGI